MLTTLKTKSIIHARKTAIKKNRYYLFCSDAHEDVHMDFTNETIDRFLELWNADKPYKSICKTLRVTEMELTLIALDLQHAGRLPERKNGFWGIEND